MDRKIIHIEWKGPLTFNQVAELNKKWDYGVYQIYGDHPIYGQNILLYIGQAAKQTFAERIALNKGCHEDFYNLNRPEFQNVYIYVGRLTGYLTPKDDEWNMRIDLVEQLLIYVHTPPHNASSVKWIGNDGKDIYIFNWGNFKRLLPEVSGERWLSDHWKELEKADYKPYEKQ